MSAAAKLECPICKEKVARPFSCKLCKTAGCVYCRPACAKDHLAFTFSIATPGKRQDVPGGEAVLTMREAALLPPPPPVSAPLFPLPW